MKHGIILGIIGLLVGIGVGSVLPKDIAHSDMNMQEEYHESDMGDIHEHTYGSHEPREVSGDVLIPSVALEVFRDETSGYNAKITTENFTFNPEQVNTSYVSNEGHAHIYVGEEKVGRVYGEWFHIDGKHFSTGSNIISVTLNGNDHSELTHNGEPISAEKEIFE